MTSLCGILHNEVMSPIIRLPPQKKRRRKDHSKICPNSPPTRHSGAARICRIPNLSRRNPG